MLTLAFVKNKLIEIFKTFNYCKIFDKKTLIDSEEPLRNPISEYSTLVSLFA